MIVQIREDPCKACGLAGAVAGEYRVKRSKPLAIIEFDKLGNRYIVFQLDDPPEGTKQYRAAIKDKRIKVTRK